MNKTEIENQIQQIKDELRIIEPMMIEDDDKDVKDRIKTLYSELNDLNEKADTISPDEEDEREMRREQEIEDNIEIKDSKNKRFYKQGGSVYSSDSKTKINAEELISLANSSTPYDTENSGRGEITDIEGAISILKNKYPEYQDLEVSDFYEEEDNSLNEDYEESKESGFPKNSDNITKDELHEHFDLDNDGKVTLDEYAQHINYHCDNPETLDEELEQSDYDKGFKYKKGGNINESLSSEEKELLMMASLVVLKEPNTSYFDDSRKQKLLDLTSKLRENYAWGGFIIGGLLGGYAGYKYGLTQTKRKFNNLFKEEEKFVSDLKKRGEKMEKEGKKEKEKLKKEKRKVKESDYEDIFKEGGDLDANGFDTETNIKSNQEEILELKEFLKTATDKEDIEQAKLSIEELENEIMYNYGLGGYMIAGGVGAYYGAKNPKAVRKVTDPIDKAVSDIGKNLTDKKFEKGGQIDYFEQYELLEKEYPKIYEVVFEQGELTDYKETERLLNKLNSMGWTFDYGLDNSPYDLRPFASKVNMPSYEKGGVIGIKTERDFKGKDLITALDKAKIKYKMNRLSMTLLVLKVEEKDINDTKKIINDLGLSVMMKKGGEIEWVKNIDADYGWETTQDNKGGYISKSGNWEIYKDGRWVADEGLGRVVNEWETEDGAIFDGTKGKWQVYNNEEWYGDFTTLKEAKAYVKRYGFRNPNKEKYFAKGGETPLQIKKEQVKIITALEKEFENVNWKKEQGGVVKIFKLTDKWSKDREYNDFTTKELQDFADTKEYKLEVFGYGYKLTPQGHYKYAKGGEISKELNLQGLDVHSDNTTEVINLLKKYNIRINNSKPQGTKGYGVEFDHTNTDYYEYWFNTYDVDEVDELFGELETLINDKEKDVEFIGYMGDVKDYDEAFKYAKGGKLGEGYVIVDVYWGDNSEWNMDYVGYEGSFGLDKAILFYTKKDAEKYLKDERTDIKEEAKDNEKYLEKYDLIQKVKVKTSERGDTIELMNSKLKTYIADSNANYEKGGPIKRGYYGGSGARMSIDFIKETRNVGDFVRVETDIKGKEELSGTIESLSPFKIRTDAKSVIVIPNRAIKNVNSYAKGGTIRKGDYVRDARGELGLVNKVSKGVAYVKYPSTNKNAFEPVFLDSIKIDMSKGYHKGKKVYVDVYDK